jgi:hypothetical protein
MIRLLTDDEHDRIWRILRDLLDGAGARAALLCDTASGALLLSVGDAGAQGEPDEVRQLGPRERIVRGPAGQMYGLDVPGDMLLAVLHDESDLPGLRKAAAKTATQIGAVLGYTEPRKKKLNRRARKTSRR